MEKIGTMSYSSLYHPPDTPWAHSILFTTICNRCLRAGVTCFRCHVMFSHFQNVHDVLCGYVHMCVCVCSQSLLVAMNINGDSVAFRNLKYHWNGIHWCKFHSIESTWLYFIPLWHEVCSYWKLSESVFLFLREF